MQLSRNCRAALAALIVALAPALAFAAIDPLKDAIGLAKVGRYSEAQSAFQRLADEAANHPTALVLILLARADAYFAAGEFGRSQSALDAARALPLPLSEALASRARALAAKLKEKLAFQQVSGFVTVATVHDARVRHRVTTLSGGVELVEVCDDFLSFDDDDDDSAAFDNSERAASRRRGQIRPVFACGVDALPGRGETVKQQTDTRAKIKKIQRSPIS
jgi:tetratricopeptide (TPR) repeat protein